jgi:hypothetical protein
MPPQAASWQVRPAMPGSQFLLIRDIFLLTPAESVIVSAQLIQCHKQDPICNEPVLFMKRLILRLFLLGLLPPFLATPAIAQNLFDFDEFGHGNIVSNGINRGTFGASLAPDTTPGGLANWLVLVYTLPFSAQAGDILVQWPNVAGNPILDVLRFDGANHLLVYSDSVLSLDSPADTPGPPDPFSGNAVTVSLTTVNPQLGFAEFTPLAGQPGYNVTFSPTYHFLDPGVVPEPRAGALLVAGLGFLILTQGRRVGWNRKSPESRL